MHDYNTPIRLAICRASERAHRPSTHVERVNIRRQANEGPAALATLAGVQTRFLRPSGRISVLTEAALTLYSLEMASAICKA